MASSSKKQRRTTSRKSPKKVTPKSQKRELSKSRLVTPFLLLAALLLVLVISYCLKSCLHPVTSSIPTHTKTKTEHAQAKKSRSSNHPKDRKQKHIDKSVLHRDHTVKTEKPPKEYYEKAQFHKEMRSKLVIIIDDVHTMAQLHAITSLSFPVTPSIFPPYTRAPHTPRLATHAIHYMVHLPMESGNAKYDRQSKTLKTTFSREQMEVRIRELRRLFPRAHYINNHTGSRFTADADAMQMLYTAMRKEGFAFVDSLTTGASKVKQIAYSYGDAYVARDVFIDNRQQIRYIHRQLKKAVKIAKKKGYAIAIGHPHRVTFEALRKAKPLLKEVEVVYIDELFRR
jgi:polysaccharide deacetylase 2 family uncharacterized protein YibQ